MDKELLAITDELIEKYSISEVLEAIAASIQASEFQLGWMPKPETQVKKKAK